MVGTRVAVCCAWILASAFFVQSDEMQDVFGILGKSTTITCPLESTGEVEWYDWAYSLDEETPATLYKDGAVTEDEWRTGRLSVNAKKGTLTISDLIDDDAGQYFCQNVEGDKYDFTLATGTMPECVGDNVSDLRPTEEVKLQCSMSFSGKAPVMEWLREDESIETKDKTAVGKVEESATVIVEPEMDGQTFTCRVTLGEIVEECDLQFVVKYAVQDLMFTPEKAAYTPGSEFICSAKGNPTPTVTVTLPDGEKKMGSGEVKVVIPNEWIGKSQTVKCDANNTHDGLLKSDSISFDFDVAKAPEPEEPAEATGENGEVEPPAEAGTQTAAIVAGVVIGAVVLVIIIIAVICVKKRQSKPPKGSKPVPTKEDGKADNVA